MSLRSAVRAYKVGAGDGMTGWYCCDCNRIYDHYGKHLRTFARVSAHAMLKHRRLPRSLPTKEVVAIEIRVWEWTR